jgi:prepilin-type N-terminal cleavage/methylation domain-containing protein
MKRQMSKLVNKQGFTLVEVLIATAVAGVVMSAIYYTYYSQQKSYIAQESVRAPA